MFGIRVDLLRRTFRVVEVVEESDAGLCGRGDLPGDDGERRRSLPIFWRLPISSAAGNSHPHAAAAPHRSGF